MFELGRYRTDHGTIVVAATERVDGDVHPLNVEPATLRARQVSLTLRPWTMLDEVHGVECVEVSASAGWQATSGRGDIVVARPLGGPIAIWVADCAPVMLIGSDATVLGIHAGWRGLAAGVVGVAVDTMEGLGVEVSSAVVGPCIRKCCYEFGESDLLAVASGVGVEPDDLAATSSTGGSALDMPTAVAAALARRGVEVDVEGTCTGCDDRFFSHRMRRDAERHAMVATMEHA